MNSPDTEGIVVRGLTKSYGRTRVLRDVSYTAPAGRITGLLGPNGSGKSTIMRVMTAVTPSSGGAALFDGVPYRDLANPGAVVGSLLDASAHHPGRTVMETVRQAGFLMGAPAGRATALIRRMGLGAVARRRFGALSLGMRQRVGLAIAFLGEPRYLILDEPMNGLDVESIGWIRQELLRFAHDEGGTVIISSHLLQELQSYVDRVAIVSEGRVVLERSLDVLKGDEGCEVVVDDPSRVADELTRRGIPCEVGSRGAIVARASSRAVGAVLLEMKTAAVELRSGRTFSLEDTYLRVTRGEYSLEPVG